MGHRLTKEQIVGVCRELLRQRRRVGVRDVTEQLLRLYGRRGRTERVAAILREEERAALPSPSGSSAAKSDVEALREQVHIAEEQAAQAKVRAARAEEMERRHQDFWAARYAERVEELERRYAELARP